MGFLGTIRNWFGGSGIAGTAMPANGETPHLDARERIRRWQGSRIDRVNQAHWSHVTGQPINAELSAYINDLRNRSEAEISENSLIQGMVSSYTLSCLGAATPTLRLVSDDQDYAERRQRIWQWWCQNAGSNQQLGLAEIMRTWIRSLFSAGEFVNQIITVNDAEGPVKMRLLPIHSHRLLTPPQMLGDPEVAMGVRRDLKNRRPVCYYISQPYIMGAFEVYTGQFLEVPYKDLLHGFILQEEDQVRGVPWLAPCLDKIGQVADATYSMLDSVKAAGDWGVYLYSEHPEISPIQMGAAPPPDVTFERRQERYVPPGWQPRQVSPQQPPANWDSFYRSLVTEIGLCVNMPLLMMLLDSSNHNYASARFDSQLFWRGIKNTQGFLTRHLDRLENVVAQEATIAYMAGDPEGLPPSKDSSLLERRWLWPQAPEVDSSKERMADRLAMENGTATLTEMCARDNKDIRHVIEERKKEKKLLEDAGLPGIPGIPEKGNGGGDSDEGWKAPERKGSHLVAGNGKANGAARFAGVQ
jgi:capsid protein